VSGQNSEYAVRTDTHKNVLRRGDALACLLFNTAIDRVIRGTSVTRNIRGPIFSESVRNLAYADDTDITGRTQGEMNEGFYSLEKAARKMHLQMNQGRQSICQQLRRAEQVAHP
jgi:hypothetical protein